MSNTIAILIPEASPPIAQWDFGKVVRYPPDLPSLVSCVNPLLVHPELDALLFWDPIRAVPDADFFGSLLASADDLWHAGLKLGMGGQPALLDFVAPTWMFNRDPAPEISAASWRLSLKACLVRAEVIRQVGFLNPAFHTLEAAALEWGFRCMQRGVFCRAQPDLLPGVFEPVPPAIPALDELRFIQCGYGKRWAAWALGRAVLSRYVSVPQAVKAYRSLRIEPHSSRPKPFARGAREIHKDAAPPAVTVLIPTLERYPYLHTLLSQLRKQTKPPAEIIIVDQTPADQRQEEIYAEFGDLPLKVIYQDQPGQCSSRNAGLQAAQGDLILFIDDDDEVPADLLEKHLLNIQRFQADASCGVAHEVGAGRGADDFGIKRIDGAACEQHLLDAGGAVIGGASGASDGAGRFDGRFESSGGAPVLPPPSRRSPDSGVTAFEPVPTRVGAGTPPAHRTGAEPRRPA